MSSSATSSWRAPWPGAGTGSPWQDGPPEPAEPAPGVRVLPLRAPGDLYTAGGKRRTRAATRFALDVARVDLSGYDLVETANIPYLHLMALAPRCAASRIPLCVTWHEYWGRYWREYLATPWWRPYAWLEQLTAHLGAGAIAVSQLTAERLARHRKGAVHVIGNGIPVAEIRAAAGSATAVDTPLIYAGRLLPEKRIDLLLEAVRALVDRGLGGCLLTIIGDGPDRSRLTELAHTLGVGHAVRFVGRLPTETDVWRALGRARVAVQPSSREGFGRFPLEAMAAGRPVVYCASGESAVGEIVQNGIEGLQSAPTAGGPRRLPVAARGPGRRAAPRPAGGQRPPARRALLLGVAGRRDRGGLPRSGRSPALSFEPVLGPVATAGPSGADHRSPDILPEMSRHRPGFGEPPTPSARC